MNTARGNGTGGGVIAALLLSTAIPASAWAGPPQSLREALFGDHGSFGGMPEPPPVARYRLDVGASFVVDRLGRDEALLKFDGGDEVWALKGVNAAHGDMIFKNDLGEPVLRATRWGGVTLFTPARPEGAALPNGPLDASRKRLDNQAHQGKRICVPNVIKAVYAPDK